MSATGSVNTRQDRWRFSEANHGLDVETEGWCSDAILQPGPPKYFLFVVARRP